MLICDRFVYIHMPKTGGTFVRSALSKLLENCGIPFLNDRNNKHAGIECIPDSHRHLPVLATVRCPFDHLVSLYEFNWWKNHPEDTFDEDAIRRRFSYYPEISFEEFARSVYDWSLLSRSYVSNKMRAEFETADIGPITLDYIRYFASSPAGLWTSTVSISANDLANAISGTTFINTERLNEELCSALASLGFCRNELDLVRALGRIVPAGSTRDASQGWQHYYSPELKQLVRDRERMLFTIFPEFDV